jgi:hypothetical protein
VPKKPGTKTTASINSPVTGVRAVMNIYENSYFGFRIEFPEGWRHRYWGNWKNPPTVNLEQYQISYGDLPVVEDSHKELFFALTRVKGSPAVMSCSASMAAFYRKNSYDLHSERKRESVELVRRHGQTEVMGIEANYLYLELNLDSYTCFRRYTYWKHAPNIWLNLAIEGDTKENYAKSEAVLSGIRKL